MKAIVLTCFGQHNNFALQEVEDPVIKEDEVLVKIMAVSFNPVDYQIRLGLAESKLLSSPILGREMAGIIVEVGDNVSGFSIGDEVMAYVGSLGSNGTLAELIAVPFQLLSLKPPSVKFWEAAAIPMVGLTAIQCFKKIKVHQNERIFIAGGAGGVGSFLIQLLLSKGIRHLITTAGNVESKKHLVQLGIPERDIVNYRQSDFIDIVKKRNSNLLFDSCVDLVGGEFSHICSSILRSHGSYVNVTNNLSNRAKEQLFDKGVTIYNISNYANALNSKSSEYSYYGKELTLMMSLISNGMIKPPACQILEGLTIGNVLKAFGILENNQTRGKKIVLTMGKIDLTTTEKN